MADPQNQAPPQNAPGNNPPPRPNYLPEAIADPTKRSGKAYYKSHLDRYIIYMPMVYEIPKNCEMKSYQYGRHGLLPKQVDPYGEVCVPELLASDGGEIVVIGDPVNHVHFLHEEDHRLFEISDVPDGWKVAELRPNYWIPQEAKPDVFSEMSVKIFYCPTDLKTATHLFYQGMNYFPTCQDPAQLLFHMNIWAHMAFWDDFNPITTLSFDGVQVVPVPSGLIPHYLHIPHYAGAAEIHKGIMFMLMSSLGFLKTFQGDSHWKDFQKKRYESFMSSTGWTPESLEKVYLPATMKTLASTWAMTPSTSRLIVKKLVQPLPTYTELQTRLSEHAMLLLSHSGMASFLFALSARSAFCDTTLVLELAFLEELEGPFQKAAKAYTADNLGQYAVLLNVADRPLYRHAQWPILAYAGAALNKSFGSASLNNFRTDERITPFQKGLVDTAILQIKRRDLDQTVSEAVIERVKKTVLTATAYKPPAKENDKLTTLLEGILGFQKKNQA